MNWRKVVMSHKLRNCTFFLASATKRLVFDFRFRYVLLMMLANAMKHNILLNSNRRKMDRGFQGWIKKLLSLQNRRKSSLVYIYVGGELPIHKHRLKLK